MAKSRRKNKKVIWFSLIGALVLVIIIIAVAAGSKDKTIKVSVTEAKLRDITQTVSATGKIQPETEVKVSSETSGEIIFLGVQEGDTVIAGQMLVRIKPDLFETQLEQIQAASDAAKTEIDIRRSEMNRAEAELKRTSELYGKEFISKQEYERVKSAYEQAQGAYQASLLRYQQSQANLKEMRTSLNKTTIFAPISGIVTKLDVEKGEKVVGTAQMQGTEMMRISNLNVMNAVVEVDENDIVNVGIGDMADIEIDAFPELKFRGTVTEIGHSAKVNQLGTQDQVTNFEVKVRIINPDNRMRPGMSCNVDIQTETRKGVVAVPLQSVTMREKQTQMGRGIKKEENDKQKEDLRSKSVVFLAKGNKAKMASVDVGISDKGFIEVRKGLKPGAKVISGSFTAISKELQEGSEIVVESKSGKKNDK